MKVAQVHIHWCPMLLVVLNLLIQLQRLSLVHLNEDNIILAAGIIPVTAVAYIYKELVVPFVVTHCSRNCLVR